MFGRNKKKSAYGQEAAGPAAGAPVEGPNGASADQAPLSTSPAPLAPPVASAFSGASAPPLPPVAPASPAAPVPVATSSAFAAPPAAARPQPSASESVACESCGAQVPITQRYCTSCGQRRSDAEVPFAAAVASGSAAEGNKRSGSLTPALAVLIICLAVLFLGTGILIGRSSAPQKAAAPQIITVPQTPDPNGQNGSTAPTPQTTPTTPNQPTPNMPLPQTNSTSPVPSPTPQVPIR